MPNYKNILKVVLVIIGTIIGAGFASGKEIYNFFVIYNEKGIIGIIIAGIITGIIIYNVLKIINKNNINSNEQFISEIHGNKILYSIVNIFLLITFYIMIAGFSSFFKQELDISTYITSTILCILLYFVLINRTNGIVTINSIVIPILLVVTIYIIVKYFNIPKINHIFDENWYDFIIKAILYASYNSIVLIPILISLKKYIKNKKDSLYISIIVSVIVIGLAIGIFGILVKNADNIKNVDLPIISVINNNIEKWIYAVIIEIAIFTSAVAAGYGVLENLNSISKKEYRIIVLTMCVIGIPISGLGFGNLITIIYPIFGILGLFEIILIFKKSVAKVK